MSGRTKVPIRRHRHTQPTEERRKAQTVEALILVERVRRGRQPDQSHLRNILRRDARSSDRNYFAVSRFAWRRCDRWPRDFIAVRVEEIRRPEDLRLLDLIGDSGTTVLCTRGSGATNQYSAIRQQDRRRMIGWLLRLWSMY